ncbi:MAG TPA: acyl-CoA dehydrogenase family protein [Gemmatimonadales bacterium]|nr:acyl-CoA dehydrogenase family protein [Gemmatimonadales bacterium]
MTTAAPSPAVHDSDTSASPAPLLAAARGLGPLIREHAAAAERDRRLAPEVIAGLTEAGLYRLLLPRSLGGLEVDPVTCSQLVEMVAGFDSAAGWSLQAGNLGGWWAARLTPEGTEEIYGENPSAMMAAAFHPPQQARETDGGYRIDGRGPLASNIHQADWLFLTALVMDGDQPRMVGPRPEVIAVVLRASEVEVVDTWRSLGMRGTDSNDVVMAAVFVPRRRAFPLVPGFEPPRDFRGPLYRFPAIGAAVFTIAPVALAVARGAIDEVLALAAHKTAFGFTRPLRDRPAVQATIARAEGLLRSARLLYYDTMATAWARTVRGEPHTLAQKADLLLAGTHAAATAAAVAELMHGVAGTSGVYERSPLERHFRDAHTLRHHGFMSANRFEAVGQVYCGVMPEFDMVAF